MILKIQCPTCRHDIPTDHYFTVTTGISYRQPVTPPTVKKELRTFHGRVENAENYVKKGRFGGA